MRREAREEFRGCLAASALMVADITDLACREPRRARLTPDYASISFRGGACKSQSDISLRSHKSSTRAEQQRIPVTACGGQWLERRGFGQTRFLLNAISHRSWYLVTYVLTAELRLLLPPPSLITLEDSVFFGLSRNAALMLLTYVADHGRDLIHVAEDISGQERCKGRGQWKPAHGC